MRFFVLHLDENDLTELGRPTNDTLYEIQLLDSHGRAKACGYVGTDEKRLELDGKLVPVAVLEAARRQAPGQGEFVNEDGRSLQPF